MGNLDVVIADLTVRAAGRRVAVAMSGGVDSTVTAALLTAAGADVTGVTLLLWGGARQGRSCSTADNHAATAAAAQLGIPHVTVDLTEEFNRRVIGPFAEAARQGRTGNPCITCNQSFKLDWLHTWAAGHGYDLVATGHHAQVVESPDGARIGRSVDPAKDQSYVLAPATAEQIGRLLLPLGTLTKTEVRVFAARTGLSVADTPDSMGLCFSRADLHTTSTPATVTDRDGTVLGMVPALEMVTVGQRRGLNLPGGGTRKFVVRIDPDGRNIMVGTGDDLMTGTVTFTPTWVGCPPSGEVRLQTSAHGTPIPGTVTEDGTFTAHNPFRRPAPGQWAVIYTSSAGTEVVCGHGPVV